MTRAHEVIGHRQIIKPAVPGFAGGHDHAFVSDGNDVHLLHRGGVGDTLWQSDRLTFVTHEEFGLYFGHANFYVYPDGIYMLA